ncbi:hypothetical protein L917_14114 [Phytophthora nicotianae]|uniref:Uncharacterized protein n=1 Tax=Phytophthora nicotianae TaxID=4792 RepID=W2MVC5_PHYNI|nr:hypothetical protein L917_14114 [Phytophthora nicotianae]ETM39598.1 hypothetical protein L914_14261 [Phytophthora nicotianae]
MKTCNQSGNPFVSHPGYANPLDITTKKQESVAGVQALFDPL